MVSMSTDFSGLTEAQTELIKHWHACCQHSAVPAREYLDPGAIRSHLSCISIVEMASDGRTKFRLAGTGLRQIFGREMRGRYLSELEQTAFEMWSLGLARALDIGQPIGGLIERQEDSHAWLRLPLQSDRFGALVLCHDTLVPTARLVSRYNRQSRRTTLVGHNLAA